MNRLSTWLLPLLTLTLLACNHGGNPIEPPTDPTIDPNSPFAGLTVDQTVIDLNLPQGFPRPQIPNDNPLTTTKVALGKRLFFEKALSIDSTISCNSCHFQENAFADPRQFSLGVGGAQGAEPSQRRNAPPLFNLAWHKNLFWDGSVEDPDERHDHLERQIRVPIEAPQEMNSELALVVDRLNADTSYRNHFYRAFGDTSVSSWRVQQAIASFERAIISGGSKYDQFVASDFDSAVLTPSEYRGYQLYFAETGSRHAECFHCHGGYNFDDPEGNLRQNGVFDDYDDFGRYLVTGRSADYGKFKVPSLRNIEYTAPYMHDGSIQTLEEVLDRYVAAPDKVGLPNRDPLIDNIILTEDDKDDVIAFLKTLSDPEFLTNPAFQPE